MSAHEFVMEVCNEMKTVWKPDEWYERVVLNEFRPRLMTDKHYKAAFKVIKPILPKQSWAKIPWADGEKFDALVAKAIRAMKSGAKTLVKVCDVEAGLHNSDI